MRNIDRARAVMLPLGREHQDEPLMLRIRDELDRVYQQGAIDMRNKIADRLESPWVGTVANFVRSIPMPRPDER